jgi:hypothetical protein
LEQLLKEKSNNVVQDRIREATIIFLGNIAKHLDKEGSDRISGVVDNLLSAISTPSEAVQKVCRRRRRHFFDTFDMFFATISV